MDLDYPERVALEAHLPRESATSGAAKGGQP